MITITAFGTSGNRGNIVLAQRQVLHQTRPGNEHPHTGSCHQGEVDEEVTDSLDF